MKKKMKIAVPLAGGLLSMHFGHCEKMALLDVDVETKKIETRADAVPPPHEPGVIPQWLAGLGVQCILAGGMGQRALDIFAQNGIQVVVGAPRAQPEAVVQAFLEGTLVCGINGCNH